MLSTPEQKARKAWTQPGCAAAKAVRIEFAEGCLSPAARRARITTSYAGLLGHVPACACWAEIYQPATPKTATHTHTQVAKQRPSRNFVRGPKLLQPQTSYTSEIQKRPSVLIDRDFRLQLKHSMRDLPALGCQTAFFKPLIQKGTC